MVLWHDTHGRRIEGQPSCEVHLIFMGLILAYASLSAQEQEGHRRRRDQLPRRLPCRKARGPFRRLNRQPLLPASQLVYILDNGTPLCRHQISSLYSLLYSLENRKLLCWAVPKPPPMHNPNC